MKVLMQVSIPPSDEIIDLEDWGFEEDVKWSDLSEEDQNEIRDSISEQIIVEVFGKDIEED